MADASLLENLGPGEDVAIIFEVTQDDIDHGVRSNCNECPVARSAAREFPGYEVSVGISIHLHGAGGSFRAALPATAENFITSFDYWQPVDPFFFTAHFQAYE